MRPQNLVLAAFLMLSTAASAQDIEAGKKLFARCAACHNAETTGNKVGPHLMGVIGRPAGSLDGYNYSKAMKDSGDGGLVWDEVTLGKYLSDPRGTVPGTKMAFPGLKKPVDLENIIAYLESVSG
ncbi:c-type cytochrome [Chelativorans sp. YIM 93263]|uniref:c-type cytochrome n=1 Tax=Chelativorans sp. YIM 93263 TaxID=2906648 RepID=UPI002379DEBC|nr:cytochrome c family protein [Chelativorans sp. YIM 93263]